ncbi:MAG: hypothetical protein BGP21_06410 [Thiobacillus sp. 65-29]|nr:MAG: hypothetical protein BGP21_06410 [Thiobacillus sp. 65-29]
MTEKTQVKRAEGGKLLPGHGLKSPGRPRGKSPSEQVRDLIEPHKAEIIAKAVQLAKMGDPTSIKVCLERLAPAPRPEAEKVVVPGLKEAETLQDKATAILAAVADGEISAEAGDKLLRMLDTYAKAVVVDEHERRLRTLEGKPALEGSAALLSNDTEDEPE